MADSSFRIDRRALMKDLESATPILVKVARERLNDEVFLPAVESLKEAFDQHPVTEEIRGGIDSPNISDTLDAHFREEAKKGDSPANLTSFIGFDEGDDPLEPIEERLDPSHPDGPKMVYKNKDSDSLTFHFEVKAPSTEAIYDVTPMPWGSGGISWAKRIEQGIPGVGYFLNSFTKKGSRSGGGIQIGNQLRGGTYRATSYLSGLFKGFIDSIRRG